MIRDDQANYSFLQGCTPQHLDDNDVTGEDIDTQGYESLTFVVSIGQLSEVNSVSYVQFVMQHASASTAGGAGTYSAVSAIHVLGVLSTVELSGGIVKEIGLGNSGVAASLGSYIFAVGYRGYRRYCRLNIDCIDAVASAAAHSDAGIAIIAMLGYPANWPVNEEFAIDRNNV